MIIIGSGLAGYTLVREIRKLNLDCPITLITKDNGDYYSKPQLSSALSHQKTPENLVLINAEKFASQFNFKLIPHTQINHLSEIPEILKLSPSEKNPQKIILCTGAYPVKLRGLENLEICTINNLTDYQLFRAKLAYLDKLDSLNKSNFIKNIIIIGSGLVGCEFANDLLAYNIPNHKPYKITIISPDSYPLMNLVPEPIGKALQQALSDRGVIWRLGEFFDPDEFKSEQNSSIILSAIGLKPDIQLAQSAGIETNKGIIVDKYLCTSQPDIYALGDCAEFGGKLLPYVAPIAVGARALAKTLLGEPTAVVYPPMPIYIKTACYPIVALLPEESDLSESKWQNWHIEKERALFYDSSNLLKGFVLGGIFASEVNEWLKKLSFS